MSYRLGKTACESTRLTVLFVRLICRLPFLSTV
nr:MAG TPA: hypothetical protein [Caudoviricetes sp.]